MTGVGVGGKTSVASASRPVLCLDNHFNTSQRRTHRNNSRDAVCDGIRHKLSRHASNPHRRNIAEIRTKNGQRRAREQGRWLKARNGGRCDNAHTLGGCGYAAQSPHRYCSRETNGRERHEQSQFRWRDGLIRNNRCANLHRLDIRKIRARHRDTLFWQKARGRKARNGGLSENGYHACRCRAAAVGLDAEKSDGSGRREHNTQFGGRNHVHACGGGHCAILRDVHKRKPDKICAANGEGLFNSIQRGKARNGRRWRVGNRTQRCGSADGIFERNHTACEGFISNTDVGHERDQTTCTALNASGDAVRSDREQCAADTTKSNRRSTR